MAIAHLAQPSPLIEDSTGAIRVGSTRIPLERVVYEWNAGESPESIAENFPDLDLGDVYAAIAYYLHHRGEVEAYIQRRSQEADRVRAEMKALYPQHGLRERLLARLGAESLDSSDPPRRGPQRQALPSLGEAHALARHHPAS